MPLRLLLPFQAIGAATRGALGRLGGITNLALLALRGLLHLRRSHLGVLGERLKLQIRFTALDALPLATLTALLLGGVTLLQVHGTLQGLGAEATLSALLARLVIRELGPLLCAILVIARSATAIATEMASMKQSGEVDTLVALGLHPAQSLLLVRLLGGMVSLFCLVVWFDLVTLMGGFALAWLVKPMSLRAYLEAVTLAVGPMELGITLLKALVFGAAIPLISLGAGLRVGCAPTEIPQAVTRAAVQCLVTVLLAGALLSAVCYG